MTVRNHQGWGTFGFDFGLYDQAMWLMSRFKAPFVTIMGRNLFGDHTSFILLPLVPFYWLWPDGRVLLIAQSCALGLAAIPIYLIGRRVLDRSWQAATLAVAYLLHPAVAWTNVEQFHPDVFALPFLGFAFWAMLTERWRTFFVCCFAVTMVKEDTVLVMLPLGLYCALKHDRRRGLIVAGWSLLWSFLCVYVILKGLNGKGSLNGWRIPYNSPSGFVRQTIRQPGTIYDYFRTEGRPWYLWQILFPVLGIALLAPTVVVVALLPFASNMVSTFWYQHQIQYHYTAILIPIVSIATIFGVRRLAPGRRRSAVTIAIGLSSLWSSYLWGPMPLSRRPTVFANPRAAYVTDNRTIAKLVPRNAVVSAFYGYVPHLEHRVEIYQFPVPFRAIYWGTLDQEGKPLPERIARIEYLMVPSDLGGEQHTLDAVRSQYDLIAQAGNTMLFKRKAL